MHFSMSPFSSLPLCVMRGPPITDVDKIQARLLLSSAVDENQLRPRIASTQPYPFIQPSPPVVGLWCCVGSGYTVNQPIAPSTHKCWPVFKTAFSRNEIKRSMLGSLGKHLRSNITGFPQTITLRFCSVSCVQYFHQVNN